MTAKLLVICPQRAQRSQVKQSQSPCDCFTSLAVKINQLDMILITNYIYYFIGRL